MLFPRSFSSCSLLALVAGAPVLAQCNPSVVLEGPTEIPPLADTVFTARVRECTAYVEASSDGVHFGAGLGQGASDFSVTVRGGRCAGSVYYRLHGQSVCNGAVIDVYSPTLLITWPSYEPRIEIESDDPGPLARYNVRARLLNPAPLQPSLAIPFQIRDNGGAWFTLFGPVIDASWRTIATLDSGVCETTRDHRLKYDDCGTLVPNPVATVHWDRYEPQVEMRVLADFPLGPGQTYSVTSRLLNPRPLAPEVNGLFFQSSDDDGRTYFTYGNGFGAGPQERVIYTFTTPNCGDLRRHRLGFDACGSATIAGSVDASWSGVIPVPGVEAPAAISPNQQYQVTATASGVPGDNGLFQYSDDGGATWVGLGGFHARQTYTLNAGACGRPRIHRTVVNDWCGAQASDSATSCCSNGGGPGAGVTPESQRATAGGDAAFHASSAGDGLDLSYQWRRNGVPLADGANPGLVGVVSGAGTPDLTLRGVGPRDGGLFDCTVTSACGASTSNAAELVGCPADFDADGFLDFFDYDAFVGCFEAGQCPPGIDADFNGDGFTDFFDYDDFVGAFEVGC